jgi:hypothetical protein
LAISRARKNWARWLYTAFFVLSCFVTAWEGRTIVGEGPLAMAQELFHFVLGAVCVFLLFTRESNNWFNRPRLTVAGD